MIALGDLSPIDSARAKLQEQIGNFLQGRARLDRLMSNPSLTVQGQARGLYAVQTNLEDRLQNEITPKLQAISSGVWSVSDLLVIGGFTGQIIKQINDVGKLERAAGVSGMPSGFNFDISTVIPIGVILLALGMMGGMFFGRRKE
jgi:hypothetical protein